MNKVKNILIIILTLFFFSCVNKEEIDNSQSENSVTNNDFPFDEGNKILFLRLSEILKRKDGEEKFNKLKIKFYSGDKEAENVLYKLIDNTVTILNANSVKSCEKSILPLNIGETNFPNRTEKIKKLISEYDKEIIKCNESNKKDRNENISSDYDELQQRIDELEEENEQLKNNK